jgi:predicted dehydrogenase
VTTEPLKVAIVGCGRFADAHVEEIARLAPIARVVAVCDRERLMAEQLAMRYSIDRHYDDFGALLRHERPDVVHVATPPESHVALAGQALQSGCHVLVEKPLALHLDDARQIVASAEERGRLLTVGYTYLFDPPALALRDLRARGALGDPVHVETILTYDLGGTFGRALLADGSHWVHRLPGRLFHNNLDHVLNTFLEFLPDEAPDVLATSYVRRPERFGDERDGTHDELRLLVRGERVTASGVFSAHVRPHLHQTRVYGTRGSAVVDYVARAVTLESAPPFPSALGRVFPAFSRARQYAGNGLRNAWRFARCDFHFFAGLNRLLRSYYEAIRVGGPPPIPYRDLLRVSALMDQVFGQLRQGRE